MYFHASHPTNRLDVQANEPSKLRLLVLFPPLRHMPPVFFWNIYVKKKVYIDTAIRVLYIYIFAFGYFFGFRFPPTSYDITTKHGPASVAKLPCESVLQEHGLMGGKLLKPRSSKGFIVGNLGVKRWGTSLRICLEPQGQPFINGCFNWMIPKHLFINGCLGFQVDIQWISHRIHGTGVIYLHLP